MYAYTHARAGGGQLIVLEMDDVEAEILYDILSSTDPNTLTQLEKVISAKIIESLAPVA